MAIVVFNLNPENPMKIRSLNQDFVYPKLE